MASLIVLVFVFGYVMITIEHQLKIDKLIPALLMMTLTWTIFSLNLDGVTSWFDTKSFSYSDITNFSSEGKKELLNEVLLHHFGKTSEILIFLMGAMTIVELIDHFDGFQLFQRFIVTRNKYKLLWISSLLAFILSAIIDNLTATIVLVTILRKLIHDKELRMWYVGFVVISANAGGAWTPIGDVTTTMLWIAGKVTTQKLVSLLLLPSIICTVLPLLAGKFMPTFKGEIQSYDSQKSVNKHAKSMLIIGLLAIVFVPFFKTITHLPPYVGMMFSLSIFAIFAEFMSKRILKFTYGVGDDDEVVHQSPTLKALGKIEMTSVLFFLGILMTVACMESMGLIYFVGNTVTEFMPQSVFVFLIGVFSSIVDNVPLVAGSIGMFVSEQDASVWHLIAYSAGTGGSMLIIGSAAGVVAMGMEKISFGWYLKNFTWLAFLGFFVGFLVLLLII
jgi:Na+/H+ antiporter NhaD/arsenite permease-like protein